MMRDDLYEAAKKRIGELSMLLSGSETSAESNRIAAETWSARATEAEAKLAAALTEARNNHAAASSWMDQASKNNAVASSWMDHHAGLAKRMIEVQAENKRLREAAERIACDYNGLRDNLAASMRRADAAQSIADRAAANVIEREKEIADLNDRIQQIASSLSERENDIFLRTAERDHHMKRCDELVRLAREDRAELSGRIESLQLEIDDALLVVQEQSHDIVGLVKAVSRAEREVQELRSRRAKEE